MTLNELLVDCCTRLNYAPDLTQVDPKVQARLTAFLNQTQREILGQPTYTKLLRLHSVFDSIPGQSAYGLAPYVSRVVAIVDRANQRRLTMLSVDAYRRYLPDPTVQQGTPDAYAFDGWASVQRQPIDMGLSDAYLMVNPANAGNILHVSGVLGGLHVTNFTYVVTAPPPVAQQVSAGVQQLYDVYFENPLAINMSMVADPNNGALTTIATWSQGQRRGRYPQIYLITTPASSLRYDVFFERDIPVMVAPTDEPLIPNQFQYLLAAGCRLKEYELRGESPRLAMAQREFSVGLGYLNAWVADQPDAADYTVPDDQRGLGTSVLGPWYPISSYR